MKCRVIELSGAGVGFLCGSGSRQPQAKCHCRRVANWLCDFDTGKGTTCDAPMCNRHREHLGPELDYCQKHTAQQGIPNTERKPIRPRDIAAAIK